MKKLLILLMCLCLGFSVFGLETSYFNFGVGVSVAGRSDAVSSIALDAVYVPFDFNYCNPSLLVWGTASWDGKESFNLFDIGFGLSIEIGRFKFNPLQVASNNPAPWAPSVTVGMVFNQVQEEKDLSPKLYVEASIFRTLDKDYMCEWFSPFVMMNKDYKLWGITVFRFTPLYHLGGEVKI